jgi:hypothetical protein
VKEKQEKGSNLPAGTVIISDLVVDTYCSTVVS